MIDCLKQYFQASGDVIEDGETNQTLIEQCNNDLESYLHKIVKILDESSSAKKWIYGLVCTSSKVGDYLSRYTRDGNLEDTNFRANLRQCRAKVTFYLLLVL